MAGVRKFGGLKAGDEIFVVTGSRISSHKVVEKIVKKLSFVTQLEFALETPILGTSGSKSYCCFVDSPNVTAWDNDKFYKEHCRDTYKDDPETEQWFFTTYNAAVKKCKENILGIVRKRNEEVQRLYSNIRCLEKLYENLGTKNDTESRIINFIRENGDEINGIYYYYPTKEYKDGNGKIVQYISYSPARLIECVMVRVASEDYEDENDVLLNEFPNYEGIVEEMLGKKETY